MSARTTKCILNTNITKKLIDDDLFQKSFLLSKKIVVHYQGLF